MKKDMQLIAIDRVKTHERTFDVRVRRLVRAIKTEGMVRRPIIVDKQSLVVLDGHHRLEALRCLGASLVPAYLVDYQSSQVRVYLRRKYLSMKIIKQAVIYSGMTGVEFPVKTTRHLIHNRPGIQRVLLAKLL